MTLTLATWSLIFLGAASLWWPPLRRLSLALLAGGYALPLVAGFLDGRALVVIAVLVALAWMVRSERSARWRIPAHVLFVLLAVALAVHVVPGFHNLQVIGLATAIACLGLGVALGAITYAPKWSHLGWLWALNNLLLVCMTKEALFRGYLQEALSRRFHEARHGDVIAIGVAAVLFGLAHAAGVVALMVVSGFAGVGYGFAYRLGGLRAAVLAHFGLNLAHFTLFTYPMLAG